MPLRFRSVIPYTLPGVLALIGWWWYISRKKERLISHDCTEGTPTALDLRTPSADSTNGLVEKGTVSSTSDGSTHRPPKASNQRTQHEYISPILFQHTEATPSLAQSSEDISPDFGKMGQGASRPPHSALPSLGKDDDLQVSLTDHKDPERTLPLALATELSQVKDPASAPKEATLEEITFSCHSTKVMSPFPTASPLSDAERPDPEGEVAMNHSTNNTQGEIVGCVLTPASVERVDPSEADSLDTPLHVQNLHQLFSTPPALTSTALSIVQETTVTPEDMQVHSSPAEEQDLEHLAAGLITKVISAATQEVLSVTRCQDNSQPSCSSSTPVTSSRLCPELEPVAATQQHRHLSTSPSQVGCDCREATEKEGQAVPNGCSSSPVWKSVDVSHRIHQTNADQSSRWSTQSPQAVQTAPLNITLKGDEAAPLAEDSACSTCHSEDGISSEELHSSMFENQSDAIQLTDLSKRVATQVGGLVLSVPEDSMDVVCDIKGLNAMGLRNGAHGTCEVETDQSGGELSICY